VIRWREEGGVEVGRVEEGGVEEGESFSNPSILPDEVKLKSC
jgi:hypothetical protein